jgi:hypothetical protein
LYYVDQNLHRNPLFPLEPLFRSIYAVDRSFDPKSIDVFTDRANLRKLISAVHGNSRQPFRIEVEIVGETLLFTRCEVQSSANMTNSRGYGHEFEDNFTKYEKPLGNSTGHHRIVQYSIAGVTFVVRFETDGYVEDGTSNASDEEVSSLTTSFASLQIKQSKTLKVVRGGYDVPHESLLELKTSAKKDPIKDSKTLYQLWFGQVPWVFVGYHMAGEFYHIDEEYTTERREFKDFGTTRKVPLTKLARVIENIKTALKQSGKKRGIVLFENGGLHLYQTKRKSRSLPKDLLEKWG